MRLRSALLVFTLLAGPTAACAQTVQPISVVAPAAPINRQALAQRHNVTLTAIDRHAPIQLGNGDLGFTADRYCDRTTRRSSSAARGSVEPVKSTAPPSVQKAFQWRVTA